MSMLSSLNSPFLVSSAGVVTLFSLTPLQNAMVDGRISWHIIQTGNVLAFGLNLFATSRPGRIDGTDVEGAAKGGVGKDAMFQGRRGRTMLAPSGWAFAIWGPIFLGEFVFVAAQLTLKDSALRLIRPSSSSSAAAAAVIPAIVPTIKKASAPFIISQIFQSLWAASFRPKYKGNLRYISAALLSGIALSLSRVHEAFTGPTLRETYTVGDYMVYFLPLSLHFGWTTAAALVNWNGALIVQDYTTPRIAAWVGHLSVAAATGAGMVISVGREAPVFGGVISWALTALATGMSTRIKDTRSVRDRNTLGVYGIETQQRLCQLGALATGVTSVVVALKARKTSL